MKRDLKNCEDLSVQEVLYLLELSMKIKKNNKPFNKKLEGKTVGLVFQKPSNRTRVSFEVAVNQLGGKCVYLGPKEIDLGVRETTQDIAKTLSRYLDCIVARVNYHKDIEDLAKYSTVPVINGLSDLYHPCQALADVLTIKEKYGEIKGLTLAYVGDGNNVLHSLLLACAKTGISVSAATPKGYEPKEEIVALARNYAKESNAKINILRIPKDAVKDADVIYTDVWVSMGQEEESKQRLIDFKDYQINAELVKHAKNNFIFMHCLPAHRGEEITTDVIDGKNSVVFDQAENRLHIQKAILVYLLTMKKIV